MICDEIFSQNTLSGKIIEFRIKIRGDSAESSLQIFLLVRVEMSWAGVRKRLCDGNDWMVIGRGREVEEEGMEDEEEEEEGEDKEEDEEEPFSLFDADLCRGHPEAAYLDKTLRRVSRLLAFLNFELQDVIYIIQGVSKKR